MSGTTDSQLTTVNKARPIGLIGHVSGADLRVERAIKIQLGLGN